MHHEYRWIPCFTALCAMAVFSLAGCPDGVHNLPDADPNAPPSCPSPRQICGGTCVYPQSDPGNCGACGHSCPSGQICAHGACGTTCDQQLCGASCADIQTDPSNCGTCTHLCGAGTVCTAGNCACAGALTLCTGTCADLSRDPANCGQCGHACAPGAACTGGMCGCGTAQMSCGGHCIDTSTDSANCGACGHACTSGTHCRASMCVPGGVCSGAPAGVSPDAAAALALENMTRSAMGLDCATEVIAANTSADNHCNYYLANTGACVANPHVEVSGCSMFVAANFWDRMTMSGYTGSPASEDIAFEGNGTRAVQRWIDSVWHRTPVLSPWIRDVGYGGGGGRPCDTMDFGVGMATPNTVVATYPYAEQTDVPTSFAGNLEGPMPPTPPSGWPSGYPIHIYIRGSISAHDFTVAGSTTTLPHTWLEPSGANTNGLLNNQGYVLYADAPLSAHTRYHVTATGMNGGGAVNLDWYFTTH